MTVGPNLRGTEDQMRDRIGMTKSSKKNSCHTVPEVDSSVQRCCGEQSVIYKQQDRFQGCCSVLNFDFHFFTHLGYPLNVTVVCRCHVMGAYLRLAEV